MFGLGVGDLVFYGLLIVFFFGDVIVGAIVAGRAASKGRTAVWGVVASVAVLVGELFGFLIGAIVAAAVYGSEAGALDTAGYLACAGGIAGFGIATVIAFAGVARLSDFTRPALMVSYVWNGEVMDDRVIEAPEKVTLGHTGKVTFAAPALDLPEEFTLLRPGTRGYVLTLGTGMRGRLSLDGAATDVAAFVSRGAEGRFKATPIATGDWGVVELDDDGTNNVFFRYDKRKELALASMRDSELLAPALAFAIILHSVLLGISYKFAPSGDPDVFPGRDGLLTEYLKDRPKTVEMDTSQPEEAASEDGDEENIKSATEGESGKAGGEGDEPRARAPDPIKGEPDKPVPKRVEKALLTKENRKSLSKLARRGGIDDDLGQALARLRSKTRIAGSPGGSGTGTGLGFGPGRDGTGTTRGGTGKGPGGGGSVQGDFVSGPDVDSGEIRKPKGGGGTGRGLKQVAVVGTGNASGNFSGLTKAEIDRVVKSRRGLIRACYQRELNRSRGLGGKLVVNFTIDGRGSVKRARVVPGKSSLNHASVQSCVVRQIKKLKFPAKGGTSIVNYPFIFSQG